MNTTNRFTKLDAAGKELPFTATDHAFLVDNRLGVMHYVPDVADAEKFKDAQAIAAQQRMLGFDNWRCPTSEEELALVDYTHFSPASNPALLPEGKTGAVWTNQPDASAPEDCAWSVGFDGGYVGFSFQSDRFRVRAVRSVVPAGQ